ncbi:MAG: Na-translocating system protein MpsC family protein [Pleurocapsa sp.]
MVDKTLTRGEMERNLSQSVQAFYRSQLGCSTEKVSCHIINEQVAIAIKNPITPLESLLNSSIDSQFVQDLRDRIDTIIKQDLVSTIEKILGVEVMAMTINTTVNNNLTGIVALLSQKPATRDSKRTFGKSRVNKSI